MHKFKKYDPIGKKQKTGRCFERALRFFDLWDENEKTPTNFKELKKIFKKNNVDYTIKDFYKTPFQKEQGMLLYEYEKSSVYHIQPFRKGVTYDVYDHFKKIKPFKMIVINK